MSAEQEIRALKNIIRQLRKENTEKDITINKLTKKLAKEEMMNAEMYRLLQEAEHYIGGLLGTERSIGNANQRS